MTDSSSISVVADSSSSLVPETDAVSLTLTPLFQRDYTVNSVVGYRMRVDASDGVGIDNEIFRYYEKPVNPITGVYPSVFHGVCTWVEMSDLPTDAPEADADPRAFRLTYFDIVVDTVDVAQEVWELVQAQVQALLDAIRRGEDLEAGDPVTLIGV